MKNMKMKSILLLALVAALLLGTVGGTVAYLVTSTGPVTNTFTPGVVDVEINDTVSDGVKSNIVVTNKSNVDCYLRVAVVGYWVKDGQIIEAWNSSLKPDDGWMPDSDGYYYYNKIVEPTTTAVNFMSGTYNQPTNGPEGAHLEMDIMVQGIQAEGMGVISAVDAFAKANAQ